MTAQQWIESLDLQAHPEGGFYKEIYRSTDEITISGKAQTRNVATSIYFLLRGEDVSHFHRLTSDEVWYYHAGDALTLYVIAPDGEAREMVLGCIVAAGERPQIVIPAGNLFGATCNNPLGFTLVSCMVAPGFDFRDFEMPLQSELLRDFPQHELLIHRLGMNL